MKAVRLIALLVAVFAVGFVAARYLSSPRVPQAEPEAAPMAAAEPAAAPAAAPAATPPAAPARRPRSAAALAPPSGVASPAAEPAPAYVAEPAPEPEPAPAVVPKAQPAVLPAGTEVIISLLDPVSSDKSQPGDTFKATLHEPVVLEGREVVPKGARVWGEVVQAVKSGRLKQRAEIALRLTAIEVRGTRYELASSTLEDKEGSKAKRDIIAIGGGAGIGAAIGGATGGGKGAGIGAAVGAGAGTAAAALTGKRDIKFPPETILRFRLEQELKLPR